MSNPDDNGNSQGLQGAPGPSEGKVKFRLRRELTVAELLSILGAILAVGVFIQSAYANIDERITANQFNLQRTDVQLSYMLEMFQDIREELRLLNAKLDRKADKP